MTEELNFNFVSDFLIFIFILVFWQQLRNKESPQSGRTALFFVEDMFMARGVMQLEWLFYE